MAIHKKEEFTITDQQLAVIAKAMSHPARIAILKILAANTRVICGEIVELLPLAQATVSHHLKELQEAQLIYLTHEGKKSLYEINRAAWQTYTGELNHLLSLLNNKY